MYGENSSGRKVSLLNDEPTTAKPPLHHQILSKQYSHRLPPTYTVLPTLPKTRFFNRQSSCSTSPENSPSTPPLVRLNSISSNGTQTTPSPMTPSYGFDPLEQQKNVSPYYTNFARPLDGHHGYPAMPSTQEPSAQPYYQMASQQQRMNDREIEEAFLNQHALRDIPQPNPINTQSQYHNTDPSLTLSPPVTLPPSVPATASTASPTTKPDKAAATTPTSATSNGKAIKKKYPCPHAARYSCHDTFTTSGHAARHGKKHTGEKNIHCPTCNKAFTRKDNMKQHERTHKNSKSDLNSPSDPSKAASSRARKPAPKPATSAAEEGVVKLPAPGAPMLDFDGDSSRLELSNGLQLPDIMQDIKPNGSGRMPSISGRSEVDGEGDSPGLDALAHVASEMVQ